MLMSGSNWPIAAVFLVALLVAAGFVMWAVRNSPRRRIITGIVSLLVGFLIAGLNGILIVSAFYALVFVVRLVQSARE